MPQEDKPTLPSPSASAEPPKKRGPGRPRKSEAEKAAAASAPKRKRGRPRKHPLPDENAAAEPKRGPGRPPKNSEPKPQPQEGPAFEPHRGKPHRVLHELNLRRGELPLKPGKKDMKKLLSDQELNRVRMKELSSAMEYELRRFEEQLPDLIEEIYEDLLLQVAELRSEVRRKMASQGEFDDASVLLITRVVEKAAIRLSNFREDDDLSLGDLAKLSRRLGKALDRLRHA